MVLKVANTYQLRRVYCLQYGWHLIQKDFFGSSPTTNSIQIQRKKIK